MRRLETPRNPIAYTIDQAAEAVGLSTFPIRQAIDKGELSPRYSGTKPLILHSELVEWAESLPLDRTRPS